MKVTADNYEALTAFFGWMIENVWPVSAASPPDHHPMNVLRAFVAKSPSMARKSLEIGIGDLLEQSQDLSLTQIQTIDAALRAAGLPTLTAVKLEFSNKVRGILSRGRIRSEGEYHALRNVADGMTVGEQAKARAMLDAFQMRDVRK